MNDSIIKRYPGNPVLTKDDIPFDATLIFNAGVTKYQGRYVMVFRNDYGLKDAEDFKKVFDTNAEQPFKTNIGIAFSDDGLNWSVRPKPCFDLNGNGIKRAYDPRLTVIDGKCYMCFAVDTAYGIRGGVAVTENFEDFEILSLSLPDNRNMVLFPEKINGDFVRLERPFPVYGRLEDETFDVWISFSSDCRRWGDHKLLLSTVGVPFCNSKIGPAAPPLKTPAGWLTTFHAVYKDLSHELYSWHNNWHKTYYAGIMLLDLKDPSKIIGLSREPLLKPEYPYELEGFRGSVIFPGGMIQEDSGEVKIYYGAADTVECLATAHVGDLIKICEPI